MGKLINYRREDRRRHHLRQRVVRRRGRTRSPALQQFDEAAAMVRMRLLGSETFDSGVTLLRYAP